MRIASRMGWALAAAVLATAAAGAAPPAGWKTYRHPTLGWSISYPANFHVDPKYVSVSLGPDHDIAGVAFQIPAGMAKGTNLGSGDTGVSVESLPGRNCKPQQFVDPADNIKTLKADGRTYRTAASEDAGAGNFYETRLFVVEGTSPCIAVRYFIHSTNIGNYDPGTVKAFDEGALIRRFDAIRATLILKK